MRPEDYDVFLSYSSADRAAAEAILLSLSRAGLNVFDPGRVEPSASGTEAIWHALAVSGALVALIPPDGAPTPNTAAELGAAMAWNRPIYVLRQEHGRGGTPSFLREYPVYPVSRIDDVARKIKRGLDPLSPAEQDVLKKLYLDMKTPTDQFIRDPALLDQLARRFSSRAHSRIAGERLLYEMIRLRKQGKLPRLVKSGRARRAS